MMSPTLIALAMGQGSAEGANLWLSMPGRSS